MINCCRMKNPKVLKKGQGMKGVKRCINHTMGGSVV
jgi:hypothetical protein